MLTKILTVLGNVFLNLILNRIQLWWAKRQAEYYRRKAEVEKRRLESLKSGQAAEAEIEEAGDTVLAHAKKASSYEAKLEELRRRAEERKNA